MGITIEIILVGQAGAANTFRHITTNDYKHQVSGKNVA
jgi:hypothetical protein